MGLKKIEFNLVELFEWFNFIRSAKSEVSFKWKNKHIPINNGRIKTL
jgi:hypothetical protein